ncbi:DUF2306 domain-containing protein [Fibrella rubiginis]|uniref:DUF2306 domain-containing protein n=1 Tax=Fibrella rubiginis TaxID=2817060 RepID=UPI001E4382EA|nr:DUF2306 domain-containing protein [Fibrella rubiginis]
MLFHRWNGRLFILTAFAMSLDGLYLTWARGSAANLVGAIGISLNAVLIALCATMTWRYARLRQLDRHRQWALRTYLLVNGVWFFRVMLMAWILLNGGPVGMSHGNGPVDLLLAFADSLLPLAVLDLYLRSQKSRRSPQKVVMAIVLGLLTLLMGVGIFGAFKALWSPLL